MKTKILAVGMMLAAMLSPGQGMMSSGPAASTVLKNQLTTGRGGFAWSATYYTNIISASGFGLTNYNTKFYWNANQPFKDDAGDSFVGCFTNAFGVFLIDDSGAGGDPVLTFDTNINHLVVDYDITVTTGYTNAISAPLIIPSGSSSTYPGTNNAVAGSLAFAVNVTNSTVSVNSEMNGHFVGEVSATNGTALLPTYSQLAPTWMWNAFGSTGKVMSEQNLTNHVNLYKAAGLDPYIDGYMLDNSPWTGTDANGNFIYNVALWTNQLKGLDGAYRWIHTNTFNKTFILWVGLGSTLPYFGPTLTDMTNIVLWSDGVSIDVSGGAITNIDNKQSAFEREISNFRTVAGAQKKLYPISDNFAQFNGSGFMGTAMNGENVFLFIPDDILTYSTFVNSVHAAQPFLRYLRPGQYAKFPDVWLDASTNGVQSMLLMYQCALPASGFWGDDTTTNRVSDANTMISLTNSDVRAVFKDKLLSHGYLISTNGQSELWGRPLSNNRFLVVYWNTSGSAADAGSLLFRAIDGGYPMGQNFAAHRIFVNTNFVFTDSNLVSNVLPAKGSIGFILTPIVTTSFFTNGITAGGTNVNSTAQNQTYFVPWILKTPSNTVGQAEIDFQIQRSDGVWINVANPSVAGGSFALTNKGTAVIPLPVGWTMRNTNNNSGTGYTAALDANGTNMVMVTQ